MDLKDIRLLTDDVAGLAAFYRDTVGLEQRLLIDEYGEFATATGTLGIYSASAMRGILREDGTAPLSATRSGDQMVLVFLVDDVDATHAELTSRGVSFETAPHDQTTWGLRVAHFRDPDANLVELYHPLT
jgi:lactoylglutathione lyase